MAEMQRWVCGASAAWWDSRGARGLVGCVASACAARRPRGRRAGASEDSPLPSRPT